MVGIVSGAVGFLLVETPATSSGHIWVYMTLWYVSFTFDQIFIKYTVDSFPRWSNWTRMLYLNGWAFVVLLVYGLGFNLPSLMILPKDVEELRTGAALLASCSIGSGMSYYSLACRRELSATSLTILGVVCKILSVIVNVTMWEKHASAKGIVCLLACLTAASVYEQAPLKDDARLAEGLPLAT